MEIEMDEAIRGLQCIKMMDIAELMGWVNPHANVVMIFKAICIALGLERYNSFDEKRKDTYTIWNVIKKHFLGGNTGRFLQKMT